MAAASKINTHLAVALGIALGVFACLLVGYLAYGQLTHVSSTYFLNNKTCEAFTDGWTLTIPTDDDGAAVERLTAERADALATTAALPNEGNVVEDNLAITEANAYLNSRSPIDQRFVLTNTLPEIESSTWAVTMWNRGQDMYVYVDGELRTSYVSEDEETLSIQVNWMHVVVPLTPDDSGKTITVVCNRNATQTTSGFGDVFIGDEVAVLAKLLSTYGLEIIAGVMLLVLGLFCIVISIAISIRMRRPHPLWLLGVGVCLAALWLIANCSVRQFFFPDVGSIRDVAFMTVALLPMAFCMYVNQLQQGRYHLAFNIVSVLAGVNFATQFVLNAAHIIATAQMLTVNLAIVGLAVIALLASIVLDCRRGYVRDYLFVVIGMVLFSLCALLQAANYIALVASVSGAIIFMVGMLVLVVFCTYDAILTLVHRLTERREAIQRVENVSIQALEALAYTVDANDHYTSGHCERVATYSRMIGERLGMSEGELADLYYMGLLHDVGKIGISNDIINKPGSLLPEEYEAIKEHPVIGDKILANFQEMPGLRVGARWHHERFDGTGYPDGLAGEDIPLPARIVAVADAYDAMSSYRSYRDSLPQAAVRQELLTGSGSQFDPKLAAIMIEIIDEDADYTLRESRESAEAKAAELKLEQGSVPRSK